MTRLFSRFDPSRLRAALLAASLLVAATAAAAQTDRATAERLMRASGMWEQLTGVAAQIKSGQKAALEQQQLSPDAIGRIAAIAADAFSASRLRSAALDLIAQGTPPADVPALLAWFGSDVGLAVTRLEEQTAGDDRDPQVAMREGAAALAKMPEARRARLVEFVEVSRSAEGLTTLTIDVTTAIQLGAQAAAPDRPGLSAAELQGTLEAQRPQLTAQFRQLSIALAATTYAALSDAELDRYIAFLRSSAGTTFTAVSLSAFDAAMVQAAALFGRDLPTLRDGGRT